MDKKGRFDILLPKIDSSFKIGIKIHYNFTVSLKDLFSLSKMSLGDPCVLPSGEINKCSGHGICERNPDGGFKCNCIKGSIKYTGEFCQYRDFWNTSSWVSNCN